MRAKKLIDILALVSLTSLCGQILAKNSSAEELEQRTIHRRAVEAVIWGMPAVNTDLMLQEMLNKTKAKVNEIVYWSRPVDWHNQTLTPNPDAIYFMVFYNTKDSGPVVIVPDVDDSDWCERRCHVQTKIDVEVTDRNRATDRAWIVLFSY